MASYSEPLQPVTVVILALALLVLFRPSTIAVFLALLTAQLLYLCWRLPDVSNHSILSACVELTILSAAVCHAVTKRTWRIDPRELYTSSSAIVRIEVLVFYFFVVFHKLNSGFFDQEYSCGAVMYLRLARQYAFLPTADWTRWCAICLTILIEAAIPVMLVARRLRLAGLLLAFGFHFALAMDPGDVIFNFSAILLALFSLFLPNDSAQALYSTLAPLRRAWRRPPNRIVWLGARACVYLMLPTLLAALIFRGAIPTGLTREAARGAWVLYAGFVLATFLATVPRHSLMFTSARELLAVRSPWLLMFPALLFANGLMPYLGAKTETAFSMFSNLRTEGGHSNHWLMPESLHVWNYQRDLVTIRHTSVEGMQKLADSGSQWTYLEFRRAMRDRPNASVTYERNGVVTALKRAGDDPELMHPDGWAERKLLTFRRVSMDWSRTYCTH
ncbi:MAG: hypothetical protein ABL971_05990 [Vicinamibacterales bacterium]